MRVALVMNIPTPYRAPLYERIARMLAARAGEFTVVYGALREHGRQWSDGRPPLGRVRSVVLKRGQVRVGKRTSYVNPAVARTLSRVGPDVVVAGGYAPWTLAIATWCRVRRVPYLIWSAETPAAASFSGVRPHRRLWLLHGASGFLAYGPDARDYLLSLGVRPDTVTVMGNGIDVDGFAARVEATRSQAAETRRSYGLEGDIVLSVGGKNLEVVVRAARTLDPIPQIATVGTPRRGRSDNQVLELGRLPSSKMPALYAVASCLAHTPIFDLWPHAINEALSAGVPVVASPATGIPHSLCSGPGSAIVEPVPDQVARGLEEAIAVGRTASQATRAAITAPLRPWAVPAMASRFVDAVERAAV